MGEATRDGATLRILDVTKFYASVSGGVRTYLDEKMRDFATRSVEHALVIPGPREEVRLVGRTRVHVRRGPGIPFSPNYRFLVSAERLRAVVETERPHVVEVGSPFLVPHLVRRALRGSAARTIGVVTVDRGAAPDRVAGSGVGELYRHGDAGSCARALDAMVRRIGPGLRAAARRHAAGSVTPSRVGSDPAKLAIIAVGLMLPVDGAVTLGARLPAETLAGALVWWRFYTFWLGSLLGGVVLLLAFRLLRPRQAAS